MDIKNIYWLAGLFEGEISFSFMTSPRFTLKMTDHDIITRARSLTSPRSKIYIYENEKLNPKWKTIYSFTVNGSLAIQWMMTLYPIMGIRRQEKIREVIARWKLMPGSGYLNTGEYKLSPEEKLIKTIMMAKGITKEEAKKLISTIGTIQ